MTGTPRISVIIPTYNEAETIAACLEQFHDVPDPLEIIVADGGSRDRTAEIAGGYSRVRVVQSTVLGRAMQMNAGAAEAMGELLIFLHADTLLPVRWRDLIITSVYERGMVGGRFRLSISDPGPVFRWIARGNNFRSRILGITYGDQAVYTRREVFERVNGYPAIPIFEDSEFCNLLKCEGSFDWVDTPVVTSARRWRRRGAIRTVLLTWSLRLLYILSVSPEKLSRYYGAVR